MSYKNSTAFMPPEYPEEVKTALLRIQERIKELEKTIYRQNSQGGDPLGLLEDLMREVRNYMRVDQVFSLYNDDIFHTHLTYEELLKRYPAIKNIQSLAPYYNAYNDLQKLKNEAREYEEKIRELYRKKYTRSKIPDILVAGGLAIFLLTEGGQDAVRKILSHLRPSIEQTKK